MCSAKPAHADARSPERRYRRRRLSHGVTSLMYAAQQGDVERVQNIVRTQPNALFVQDRTGKTALHYCCTSDSIRAAQAADIITMAAPDLVESRDEDGFTPLHLAVIAGNTQLVTFLLANGADVSAVDNEKHTVVHWATVCGEIPALRAVLAAGAPVSTPDVHGGYPLHYAAQMCGGDKEALGLQVLHALLGHKNINVSVQDGDKRQPLLWAASAGSAKALLALVRAGALVEAPDRDGLTALHCSASRGHTDCIDTLLTLCGASPDVIDSNGCTALHYAVTLGHADATALLLAHSADSNRQDRKGRSPAHCGCAKGQFETVKLIGARGANLWMKNARGDLPLHDAAASGRRELVAWLLSMRPSQVNARNNDGRTPLHMAALNDNVDMCKILLDSGASINPVLRTSKNVFMTPLDCALQRGFRSTAKYLQLHGGVPASRLGGPNLDTQVSSSLTLQIRDDVTFWGDSSSNSDHENVQDGRRARKTHKKKTSFKSRKKKVLLSESESDAAKAEAEKSERVIKRSAKRTTKVNTATNTSASALDESPRKPASSRIDYSNEIIINGKTEINIHHSKEITVDTDSNQVSPRNVEIDSTEKITVPAASSDKEKRPKSAKFSKVSKDSAKKSTDSTPTSSKKKKLDTPDLAKSASVLGPSTGTSDDTMDTVIDTYKQKAESVKAEIEVARERMLELPEISNTSEEIEIVQELVVEASIHPEPKSAKMQEEEVVKGILKSSEPVSQAEAEKELDKTNEMDSVNEEASVNLSSTQLREQHAEQPEVKSPHEEDLTHIEKDAEKDTESKEIKIGEMKSEDKIQVEIADDATTQAVITGTVKSADVAETLAKSENTEESAKSPKETEVLNAEGVTVVKDKADLKETVTDEDQTEISDESRITKEIRDSLTKAAVVKNGAQIEDASNKEEKVGEQYKKDIDKDEVMPSETKKEEKRTQEEKEEIKAAEKAKSDESEDSLELTPVDGKTPVSKVVGKPREKKKTVKEKEDSKRVTSKQGKEGQKSKIPSKKKASEQPGVLRVLKPNEKIEDDDKKETLSEDDVHSSSSEYLSDSLEQVRKAHKSFKILSEKEALELQTKDKTKRGKKVKDEDRKPRSKSDETKYKKRAKGEKTFKSKIPTPIFQTPLSKSDRQLDKLAEYERKVEYSMDARVPSLPNIHDTSRDRFMREPPRPDSNLSAPILPSVYSDNERGSVSDLEDDARLSPTKKKKVKKRPKTRRRESKSAGSDYESSNLIDSGFEPSPRSSRIPKWKNMSERGVNMTSVTRSIQTNIRRYHLERKIFQHLLDLKRSQIRAGQHNESVLVKRAIDNYNQSCASTVGAGRYIAEDFSFKSFEKFLYESLRKLQKIDVAYLKGLPETSEHLNPLLCTQSTHRCMHATHAYTGIPCAAYLPKMDHHTIPKIGYGNSTNCKPGIGGFLPNINQKKAVTLELSHGTDKQVISLPTDKLDQNKRYYVTFTVKGHEPGSSEENGNGNGHIHSKSD